MRSSTISKLVGLLLCLTLSGCQTHVAKRHFVLESDPKALVVHEDTVVGSTPIQLEPSQRKLLLYTPGFEPTVFEVLGLERGTLRLPLRPTNARLFNLFAREKLRVVYRKNVGRYFLEPTNLPLDTNTGVTVYAPDQGRDIRMAVRKLTPIYAEFLADDGSVLFYPVVVP